MVKMDCDGDDYDDSSSDRDTRAIAGGCNNGNKHVYPKGF
jgi:hypothetical protein